MRLVRFGSRGQEKPGLVTSVGSIKDCSAHVADYDHAFFTGGGLEKLRGLAATIDTLPDAPAGARIGAPVARPGTSMRSASTTPITPRKPAPPFRPSRSCS